MSAVCIIAPVVVAAWPALSSAVVAAATSLGYQVAADANARLQSDLRKTASKVHLPIEGSEIVTDQLGRDQKISVSKDGVTVTFSRNARGQAALCVTGNAAEEVLRAMGEELSQAVVQQYVYQKLQDEMRSRGFVVVEEENRADHSIHMKVRLWES